MCVKHSLVYKRIMYVCMYRKMYVYQLVFPRQLARSVRSALKPANVDEVEEEEMDDEERSEKILCGIFRWPPSRQVSGVRVRIVVFVCSRRRRPLCVRARARVSLL